ncbi:MAG TPA: hypothetical protein VGX93_02225 [Chthoniobacterales bacterium]|nr:hypothetical protein [Chthoniobacterales bacterium]
MDSAIGILAVHVMAVLECDYQVRDRTNWQTTATIPALQAYLGHKIIQNTTRYGVLAQGRFRGFWKD